ncbi:hypothetical protein RHS03_00989, partial [Rhizoctonia solani]
MPHSGNQEPNVARIPQLRPVKDASCMDDPPALRFGTGYTEIRTTIEPWPVLFKAVHSITTCGTSQSQPSYSTPAADPGKTWWTGTN